ncbi:MAG: hypothetical protein KDB24_17860, partial [Microthrixaceae bacterium]|nr:hypothetical protein [Microthrixaceae bacterium]
TRASSELTRIDTASLPTYPDEPKRILYLALGLLFGALAGGYLTWRRLPAPEVDGEQGSDGTETGETDRSEEGADTGEIDLTDRRSAPNGTRHKVGVRSGGADG